MTDLVRQWSKFDSGLAQPLEVPYLGETYRMHGKMPALLILKGLKAERDGTADRDATSSDVLEALEAAFQPGELDRLLKTGIDFEHLVQIYTWAQRRWSGAPEPEAGEGQPPETGELEPSSSDSISSRATSNGNTGLTSGANLTAALTGEGS